MSFKFILIYAATVFIASITPGPSMLLALNHGIRYGARRTLASACGNGAATLIQALFSIAGLGAVLHHSATVFQIVKYLGAGYLVYVGIRTFFAADAGLPRPIGPGAAPFSPEDKAARPGNLFGEGFCVTIGNPKALIFFTALFPQFINTGKDTLVQSCVIVTLLLAIAFLCMMIYGYCGQKVNRLLSKSGMRKAFNRIVGGGFIGIGIGLATGRIDK